jgi:adenine-specific DNA-methyltransferase
MNGESLNIINERLERLQAEFPEIFSVGKIDQQIIENIIAIQPKKVITLDNLFNGNDQLKTNAVLQMRDAGVEFKTI